MGVLLTAIGAAGLAAAVDPAVAQERRIISSPGSDFFGGDYDVLKGVDQNVCETACLSDDRCQAYTLNVKNGWCFLKSSAGELRASKGAVSGKVVVAQVPDEDEIATREAALSFLPAELRDAARSLRESIGDEEQDPSLTGDLAAKARQAAAGDPATAVTLLREAVKREPDDGALWLELARTALAWQPDDWQQRADNEALRNSAAVDAYVLAPDPETQAQALAVLAQSMELADNWKLAIKSYRASLALAADADADTQAKLEAAVASHGFRITDNSVDTNAASPRICLVFSDELSPALINGESVGDYVSVEGSDTLPVSASGNQICVDGVKHGERYRIKVRPGVASKDGEVLTQTADLSVYVRDRDPSVRFASNAYVLPAGGEATIPVTTINTDKVQARLLRIGDRELARTIADGQLLSQLSSWEIDDITQSRAPEVWKGSVEVRRETNAEVVTAIPVSALVKELQPGVYLLTATAANGNPNDEATATQWFVVTDIGLTSFSGEDGFHVFARSLGSAEPKPGVELQLVAVDNEVLGTETTDASGHVRFAAGLLRGAGAQRPAVLLARSGATDRAGADAAPSGDFAFLDLTAQPFDLTDRGVEGRAPAGALDVFLTTERGIYRAGDTAELTGLVRDARGEAVTGLTLTGIVTRPDGVEFKRETLADVGAGGFAWPVALPANGQRGTWRFAVYTDPKAAPLAAVTALVEDFEPEKIDFTVATEDATLDPAAPPTLAVDAHYLFGAPAGGLEVSGEIVVSSVTGIDGYPGYSFGLASDEPTTLRQPFAGDATDAEGQTSVTPDAFEAPVTTRPLQGEVDMQLTDTSGRPLERTLTLPLAGSSPRIGVKPLFSGAVPEGKTAGFDLIALDAQGQRSALPAVGWVLNKITTDFQWYNTNGRWNYEPIHRSARIASGTVDVPADAPAHLDLPVEWGSYELTLTDPAGTATPASLTFDAGWYVAASSLETPDILKVSLDKPRYRIGDRATVHIEPRFAGKAEVLVMDERVIATATADIPAEGGDVTLDVTRDWGPGAYVTAVLYRPMQIEAKQMPARAIGLAHVSVDPGDRALSVAIDAPETVRPRRSIPVSVKVDGITAGETAYVTLAAVDNGILNITGFQPPSPQGFYFGQRRLGVEIRDLYSRLIDRMQGAPGTVRSGGDAGSSYLSPPPMDQLVALYSGVVTVGPDGTASVALDLPDFNGSLKLMAIAWSKTGVGQASRDMTVRDPVVVAVSRPRFLAPGDRSRIAIDVTHVEGPLGTAVLDLSGDADIVTVEANAHAEVELTAQGRQTLLVPVTATHVGDAALTLIASLPGGERLEKHFDLPVRSLAPEDVRKSAFPLTADGGKLILGDDVFADFVPGTGHATVSITGAAGFDVAGAVRALDRYPYGCTEQLTSRALPLVYLDRTIVAAGLTGSDDVRERIDKAISGVLANQSSNGAFGVWQPDSGDLWLDAYVTDFLTRAREGGYAVPDEAFTLALDNLRNTLSYQPDDPDWGPVAYAYYVLARNGRAAIGDLRYYADTKADSFPTPLARAHMAAALALYGDRLRAEALFRSAVADARAATGKAPGAFAQHYGTPLRDEAAVLTLGLETAVDGIGFDGLVASVSDGVSGKPHTSTQEDAWSLLAAHALLSRDPPKLSVGGKAVDGPYVASFDAAALAEPVQILNRAKSATTAEVTVAGVPTDPLPAESTGYAISRSYYTLEGEEADPSNIGQGDRLVAVVEVQPSDTEVARLMIDDPLPAGLEIDNPAILKSGDVATLDWLELTGEAAHTEFRADRFLAAVDKAEGDMSTLRFAYIVRAVSPGEFAHPAAVVEDMYRPERRGRTEEGHVSVVGPRR
ncbi:alpha-2-macroglobulin family protein [Mangrovibrevibacter kandeliae]|uniref:alpha-2-macroglobulin family protein n=1 Tax=Mangrovibrevibacter kandeliae TaxID=2968473 RepID=UPI002119A55E|nr:alpha-2-macroglobulin family protein [Aurantimonas sp. CSK15Z-1]MCQ8782287.1 alpha-2-macroglobulin family protein [Aurantimonas sp. CSK15Z-1]